MKVEELLEEFRKVVSEQNQAQFAPLVEAFTKLPQVEAEVVRLKAELETSKSELIAANTASGTEKSALETKITELETKIQEGSVAADATKTALETATTELEVLKAFKAEIDAKEVESARVAKRAVRLAELTADAQKVIKTREEAVQETLWSRWEAMEQAEWEVIRDSLNVAKVETNGRYVTASLLEGTLAPGGTSKVTKFEIDQFAK